jgi:hypothetical protein
MIQQAFGDQILGSRPVARQLTMRNTQGAVAQIQELFHRDRCWTIHDIAEEVGIGFGTCQQILTKEMGMRVAPKFVPRLFHHVNAPSCTSVLTQQFLETY